MRRSGLVFLHRSWRVSGPNGIFRSFRDRGISNIHVGGCVHLKMQRKLEDSAMATYSIGDLSRREILRMSAILGITSVVSTKFAFAQVALQRTPGQILGPFYPVKPFDQNVDLTRVPGRSGRAEGEILNVMGRVLNLRGEPVRNSKFMASKIDLSLRCTSRAIPITI